LYIVTSSNEFKIKQIMKTETEQKFYEAFTQIVALYLDDYDGPKPLYKWSDATQKPLIKNDLINHLPNQALAEIWALLENMNGNSHNGLERGSHAA